ncbi:cell division protein FtsZ [bacterium (Candidatus Gribaldobacteria) CG10_big_fil_rev_8_21_14_0_10_37_21]|uniref:Cell division protein FtsZ n=2 Tax=Candidatus Gribaldobacteria TaxID=2798536 RepID=A0A2H0UVA1_9BACT|nr:MAG: cell division protein FtsZ [Parcubacteria group bacterium CG1_02_37_13]PIR90748.1 MAG: cell division protein FtsZ [bacterium (Candidatus Gribaldobacteria) CG10_big_fil_rev_8_21_14_0_10_37_21]
MNLSPKIKVVGVGGSGVNAVSRMFKEKISNIELIAVNTDAQSLKACPLEKKFLIGQKITKGLGTGMDFKLGEKAARENIADLKQAFLGAHLLFLTCGLGGGTGSGAISVLGEIAKELGVLTVAVITLPFSFEGVYRKTIALTALKNISLNVDCYLTIKNDRLLELVGQNATLESSFWVCDGILREAVKAISDLISLPGIINVDFADLGTILRNSGQGFLGIGKAKGEKRALIAANMALQSPLLDFSIKDAEGILLNIAGAEDLSLIEVNIAATTIKKQAKDGAKIVFGVSEDVSLDKGEMKVTLIATAK